MLINLIELALVDIVRGRPLFQKPLDEPLFYRRYFRKWVSIAMDEKAKESEIYDNIMQKATAGQITSLPE